MLMKTPRSRGLHTLHRIPAVKLLGIVIFDVVIPVRPIVRSVTGSSSFKRRVQNATKVSLDGRSA